VIFPNGTFNLLLHETGLKVEGCRLKVNHDEIKTQKAASPVFAGKAASVVIDARLHHHAPHGIKSRSHYNDG